MRVLIFLVLIIFIGCDEVHHNEMNSQPERKHIFSDSTHTNSLKTTALNIDNFPSVELQDFIKEIEKENWISDTVRLQNTPIYQELNRDEIVYFNNSPFFPIYFENTRLFKTYKSNLIADSSFATFKKVENIWAYFYRDKNATNMLTDGVIEQWEFSTKKQAQNAYKKLTKIGDLVYFNTTPYFYNLDNKLFIFHTRAMKFSFKQAKVFKKFKTIIKLRKQFEDKLAKGCKLVRKKDSTHHVIILKKVSDSSLIFSYDNDSFQNTLTVKNGLALLNKRENSYNYYDIDSNNYKIAIEYRQSFNISANLKIKGKTTNSIIFH